MDTALRAIRSNHVVSDFSFIVIILLVISAASSTRGASVAKNDIPLTSDGSKPSSINPQISDTSDMKQITFINHKPNNVALDGDGEFSVETSDTAAALSFTRKKRPQTQDPNPDQQHRDLVTGVRRRRQTSKLTPLLVGSSLPALRAARQSFTKIRTGKLNKLALSPAVMEDLFPLIEPDRGTKIRRAIQQQPSLHAPSQLPREISSVAVGTVGHRHRRDVDQTDTDSAFDSTPLPLNRRRRQDEDLGDDGQGDHDDDSDDSADNDGDSDKSDDEDDNENGDDADDGWRDMLMLRKKRASETTNDMMKAYVNQDVRGILSDSLPAAVRLRRQADTDDDSDEISDDTGDKFDAIDDESGGLSALTKKRESKRSQMRLSEQGTVDENGDMTTGKEKIESQEKRYDRPLHDGSANVQHGSMETDGKDASESVFSSNDDDYISRHNGEGVHSNAAFKQTGSKRWSDRTGSLEVVSVHNHGAGMSPTNPLSGTDKPRRQRLLRSSGVMLKTDNRALKQMVDLYDELSYDDPEDDEDYDETDLDVLLNDLAGTDDMDLDESHRFHMI